MEQFPNNIHKEEAIKTLPLYHKLWLSIYFNTYSFVIIVLTIAIAIVNIYLFRQNYFFIPAIGAIIGLYLTSIIIKLLSSTGHKIKTYYILKRKNQQLYNPESFKKYMAAPCSRLIVKKILKDIEKHNEYASLKKKYPISFFNCEKQKVVMTMYEDGKVSKEIRHG